MRCKKIFLSFSRVLMFMWHIRICLLLHTPLHLPASPHVSSDPCQKTQLGFSVSGSSVSPLHVRMQHCSTFSSGRVSVLLNAPTVARPSETKTSWTSTCGSTVGTPTPFPATFATRASWVTLPWRTICWSTRTTAPTLVSYAPKPLKGWTCSKTT